MRIMGWSWPDYCALPSDYVEPLVEMLREEAIERRQRARRQ